MRLFRDMWVTDSLDHDRTNLYEGLRDGTSSLSAFLVALPEDDTHILDIYPLRVLKQSYYRESSQWIIGAAASAEEAEELAGAIVKTCFTKSGTCDVAAWLEPVLREADDA